jgi:hypothetical protein
LIETFIPIASGQLNGPQWAGVWQPTLFYYSPARFLVWIACILLGLCFCVFMRHPRKILVFFTGLIGVMLFSYCVHFLSIRHGGHIFVLMVACVWNMGALKNVSKWAWMAILTTSSIGGLQTLTGPMASHPFSQAKSTAEFILQEHLNELPIFGFGDAQAMTVVGYTGTPVYYPNFNGYRTFLVDDPTRKVTFSKKELTEAILDFAVRNSPRQSVLLLNDPLPRSVQKSLLRKSKIQLLRSFTDAFPITDEQYYIYLLTPITFSGEV